MIAEEQAAPSRVDPETVGAGMWDAGTAIAGKAGADKMELPDGKVVVARWCGRDVRFLVSHPDDLIQKHHAGGRFYEIEELSIIKRHFPLGGRFLDIGSNVGNHALFVALYLHAREVIVVEPNRLVHPTLVANALLNGVADRFDMRWLGTAVGAREQTGVRMQVPRRNLGAARIVEGDGDIRVMRGDAIVGDRVVDMVKIDVEGMEIDVLDGLSGLVERCAPMVFVEVANSNVERFAAWRQRNGYDVVTRYKRYPANENYLIMRPGGRRENLRAWLEPKAG